MKALQTVDTCDPDDPNVGTIARVQTLVGKRMVNILMQNAGLGVSCAGVKNVWTVAYKTGEEVDEARVLDGFEKLAQLMEEEEHELEISNPVVLSIQRLR